MASKRTVVLPIGVKPTITAPCQAKLSGRRVEAGEVSALVKIASNACNREVRGVIVLFMLLGDDVIDLVTESRGPLGESAVFAPIPSPPPDSPLDVRLHEGWFARLSDSRAFD
jgi:hypothetical protein